MSGDAELSPLDSAGHSINSGACFEVEAVDHSSLGGILETVDVARWYAASEYDKWHAQGDRMWDWQDPRWITVHGSFKNGIVFEIPQGFVYGQLDFL